MAVVSPATRAHDAWRADRRARVRARRRLARLLHALYLAPAAFLTLVFVYWPLAASTVLSFHDWNLVSPTWTAVGWQNYRELLGSRAFRLAAVNTAEATVALTALTVVAPLLLAVVTLRVAPRWQNVYRVILFSPTVVSMAIACAVWLWMFHPLQGVLNVLLGMVGIPGPAWLASGDWALRSIVLVTVWKTFGFNLVVYFAGLLSIPAETYEAARVDGASERQIFWRVTLPLLAPTTLFVLLTTAILGPQTLFIPTQILTQGGPNDASTNLGYVVYQLGFEYFRVGYASAAATVVFVMFLGLTVVQFVLGERRVHYGA